MKPNSLVAELSTEGRNKELRTEVKPIRDSNVIRGDLFVCHVTGTQKHNLLCFAVGRLIRKYVCYL